MPLLASALTWTVGAKRPRARMPQNGSHRPSRCRDRDCLRPLCRAYREGREDGWDDGHEAGFSEGYQAGYAAGAADASK